MKLFLLSLLVIGLSSPTPLSAQWWNPFGPKTVEECIAEGGKTARTETAMKFVIRNCYEKHGGADRRSANKVPLEPCTLRYDENARAFYQSNNSSKDKSPVKNTYIPRSGQLMYVQQLGKQLVEADRVGNTPLARVVAREIRLNSIEIVHGTSLSREFIKLRAQQESIEALCEL